MKQGIREWAQTACWVLFACLLLFACNLAITVRHSIEHVAASADGAMRATTHQVDGFGGTEADIHRVMLETARTISETSAAIATTRASIQQTAQGINKPCDPAPCGTLADVNRTLATARGTMGQAEIALHHEAGNLDRLDQQEQQLVQDTHQALTGAQDVIGAAHTLLADPFVPPLIEHVSASSASLDHMLSTFDQVETKATAGYLHPSKNPFVRTWRYVSPFALPAAQIAAVAAR